MIFIKVRSDKIKALCNLSLLNQLRLVSKEIFLGNVHKSKNEHGLTGLSRTGVIVMNVTTLSLNINYAQNYS